MAAIARPGVCENRSRPMNKKLSPAVPSVASGKVPAPVRVRIKRVHHHWGVTAASLLAGQRSPDGASRRREGFPPVCAVTIQPLPWRGLFAVPAQARCVGVCLESRRSKRVAVYGRHASPACDPARTIKRFASAPTGLGLTMRDGR